MSFPYERLGLLAESPVVTPGLLWVVLGMALGVILTALLFSLKGKAVLPLTLAMLTLGVAAAFVVGMLVWLSPGEHDGPIASSSDDAQIATDERTEDETEVPIPEVPELVVAPEVRYVPATVDYSERHEEEMRIKVERALRKARNALDIRTALGELALAGITRSEAPPRPSPVNADLEAWIDLFELKQNVASDEKLSRGVRAELVRKIDSLVRERNEEIVDEATEEETIRRINVDRWMDDLRYWEKQQKQRNGMD